MNKLFLFVISVFLLLSAAMWHLAELSFTEHLKIQIENVGLSATGYQITTETINASSAQNHGYIEKLSITAENKTLISIDRIDYQFDIKSLLKPVVI